MTNGNEPVNKNDTSVSKGLTKREYFAAMALQGILANSSEIYNLTTYEQYAKYSVLQADALINALNQTT